jgi:hypothetical protein
MSFPLWDLAQDLAVARGGGPVKTDPMDVLEARTLRRRLAALAWIPGAGGVLFLAGWTHSWIVGLGGFAVLLVALWLFAERPAWVRRWVHRRK